MAKPNYSYEKRQKELARQKKQEEKRLRKLEKRNAPADGGEDSGGSDSWIDTVREEVDGSGESSGGDASGDGD